MFIPKPKNQPIRRFSVENDGFYGEYYEPEEILFPGKGMVVCSGTDGSFQFTRLAAGMFAEEGMPVIALGYWNEEGTPSDPSGIPVEFLHRACLWLKDVKSVEPGVWGISLGGEYALLSASMFPDIKCVVAASPVHVITQCGSFVGGLHFACGSPFSYRGEELPYVGVTEEEAAEYLERMKKNFRRKREPDMRFYYEELLKKPHNPRADIPVERIQAPVLLISGGSDVMVPAEWICHQVIRRLEANDFSYPLRHLNYEPLSHYAAMFRPFSASVFRVERRYGLLCNKNRMQSWEETLRFLAEDWELSAE